MKKSISTKIIRESFEHIAGDQVKFIATEAGCDENYVRKILNGKRPINSAKSRLIYKACRKLNRIIENGQQKVKELIIIGEND